MGVVKCDRCDSYIDLDWNVEDIIYIGEKDIPVCIGCASEEEVDTFKRECEEEYQRKSAIRKRRNMKAINIILDERRQTDGIAPEVLFVEIETDSGCSVGIGERIEYGDYTKIRITSADIEEVKDTP